MEAEHVGDMTMTELEAVVARIVERELRRRHDSAELRRPEDARPLEEVFELIDRHMIVPKPGTPSVLEMLREDRDR